jgi:hypothetical protein
MGAKFVTVKCITKGRICVTFVVVGAHFRMRGLVYRPGHGHMVITGWGWERDEFVIHVEPLRYPQAL